MKKLYITIISSTFLQVIKLMSSNDVKNNCTLSEVQKICILVLLHFLVFSVENRKLTKAANFSSLEKTISFFIIMLDNF